MVIAFIPVRGGSKSIPLKNIKPLCGKPLVCWNIEALLRCEKVDRIVVSTDSTEIENVIRKFQNNKITLYKRAKETATDTASTESAMLDCIENSNLFQSEDTFILVQATSPLTQTHHFEEALELYEKEVYDSLLTCVRNKRFFWTKTGEPLNYDYRQRPRRQDFDGMLMENGAFYINKVKNIIEYKNRLSGKIGIYEMPEYTATEIDEPDDWAYLEYLMQKQILSKSITKHDQIKLVLTDVDGVLTDAGMYYSSEGAELKKFNTHDGMGFQLLRERGIKTGIITSEETLIVENRAKKLKVDYLFQGKAQGGKLDVAKEICQKESISLEQVAYIGDDINCFELLSAVGIAACPKNAVDKIKNIPNIIHLQHNGGEGCFREFVEKILNIEEHLQE